MGAAEQKYFLKENYNCAESVVRAINEERGLGLKEDEMKLLSAFGAGMGCGKACGALCAALSVVGKLKVAEKAHETEGFQDCCAGFVKLFEETLGSTECSALKPVYRREDVRCLAVVEKASELLRDYLDRNGL